MPRGRAEEVCNQAAAREAKEAETASAPAWPASSGLDIYGMREKLSQKGLVYRPADVEG